MSDTLTTELDEYVITDFHNKISAKFHGLILLPNGVHSLYAYFYSLFQQILYITRSVWLMVHDVYMYCIYISLCFILVAGTGHLYKQDTFICPNQMPHLCT